MAKKEWTVMFYFASDNPLAPAIVSQLKALKQAGFHSKVNVIAHFDPETENTPPHIFDVNAVNKLRDEVSRADEPRADKECAGKGYCLAFDPDGTGADGNAAVIFNPQDPFVRNLLEDKLWGEDRRAIIRESLREEFERENIEFDPPVPSRKMSGEQNPDAALEDFLHFCRRHYPAHNYMLFILGHGLVVGNDVFLFDEHAEEHSLKLERLGEILREFKQGLDKGDEFHLVSFHSCSMSGLEVAYELHGTANYMLASQSPAFVGSWTYLQILVRLFKDVESGLGAGDNADGNGRRGGPAAGQKKGAAKAVKEMLKKFWAYCFFNSYDFRLAGYSFDVALCDLNQLKKRPGAAIKNEPKVATGKSLSPEAAIKNLAAALREAVADPPAQERILLAHWDAQSFWQENYTDLYDFCFCLINRCKKRPEFEAMTEACEEVIRALSSEGEPGGEAAGEGDKLVVRSHFTGPTYQYSHGLSVFFPWSAPTNAKFWPGDYRKYKFHKATGWGDFLKEYFEQTMRKSRGSELHPLTGETPRQRLPERPLSPSQKRARIRDRMNEVLLNGVISSPPNGNGQPAAGPAGVTLGQAGARDPLGQAGARDPTGDDCGCPSIKNYPPFTSEQTGAQFGGDDRRAAHAGPAPRESSGRKKRS